MNRHFLLVATLLAIPVCVTAQINRPRPTATTASAPAPATASSRSAETAPASADGTIITTESSGVEIKLMKVEGNATNQQVTLTMLLTNPKANLNANVHQVYAVDPEGDEYRDAQDRQDLVLYTDVPKKAFRTLAGVPSKIKTLRFVKFNFWNQLTNDVKIVEFRNLKIDWK